MIIIGYGHLSILQNQYSMTSIQTIPQLNYVIYCIAIVIFFSWSCSSENEISSIEGTITGNVIQFDNYENQINDFENTEVVALISENDSIVVHPDLNGYYHFDNLPLGNIGVKFRKPGYIELEITSFLNTENIDTIPTLYLIEKIPFPFDNIWTTYENGELTWSISASYSSNETYLVGAFLCFGKDTPVTFNNSQGHKLSGSSKIVSQLGGYDTTTIQRQLSYFTDMGFNIGDNVYVVIYAVNKKFRELYRILDDFPNLEIRFDNPSSYSVFILK